MKRSLFGIASLCILTVLGMTSCTSATKLQTVWKDDAYTQRVNKVLIVACASTPATRRSLEDEFRKQLGAGGAQAVSSYTILPDPEEILDKDAVDQKIKPMDFDAVVVSRLIDEKASELYYPPEREVRGRPGYGSGPYGHYGGWHGYYSDSYERVTRPGYTIEQMTYVIETNVYAAEDEHLIYSAVSETSITEVTDAHIRGFVTVLVKSLSKNGLF